MNANNEAACQVLKRTGYIIKIVHQLSLTVFFQFMQKVSCGPLLGQNDTFSPLSGQKDTFGPLSGQKDTLVLYRVRRTRTRSFAMSERHFRFFIESEVHFRFSIRSGSLTVLRQIKSTLSVLHQVLRQIKSTLSVLHQVRQTDGPPSDQKYTFGSSSGPAV